MTEEKESKMTLVKKMLVIEIEKTERSQDTGDKGNQKLSLGITIVEISMRLSSGEVNYASRYINQSLMEEDELVSIYRDIKEKRYKH
jgi:hypothetical protein